MRMKTLVLRAGGIVGLMAFCCQVLGQEVPTGVWVRPGFKLTVAEGSIKAPRFMAFDSKGTLYVSVPREGKIYACKDKDGDGKYEAAAPFLEGHEAKNILQGM